MVGTRVPQIIQNYTILVLKPMVTWGAPISDKPIWNHTNNYSQTDGEKERSIYMHPLFLLTFSSAVFDVSTSANVNSWDISW